MKRLALLAISFFAISAGAAWADIVYLDDGRKFEGQVSEEDGQVKVLTKMGMLSFPKDKVVKIEKTAALADVYKEKSAALKDNDAQGHYDLAMWCKEKKLTLEMTQQLEKVIAINPDHADARAALGYVKIEGKWIKGKPGMVYVDGDFVKPDEAVTKGKALYKMEKYEEAFKAFDGAARLLRKEEDLADVEMYLGMCDERLGKWAEAKAAYDAILAMKSSVPQKSGAEVRKAIIASSPGGMYLVKEATGKEDIFTLNRGDKDKTKKLSGLQPLTNPDVFDIALRDKCVGFIEKGKDLLKQAKDANTGKPEGDKKSIEIVGKAEEQFKQADRLVKDIARGYLIECVKLRLGIVDVNYQLKAAHAQGVLNRINATKDGQAQMQMAVPLLKEIDELLLSLDEIQKLAGEYPDELATQLANCKEFRINLKSLRASLAAFAGK